jgi:hypothetical protein
VQAEKNSAAAGYAPPVPKLRLVPGLDAFLLALATAFVLHLGSLTLPDHGPRSADYPLTPMGLALWLLFVAYFLLWIAYSVRRNLRGFRAWGPNRTVMCGLRIVLQPMYWLVLAAVIVFLLDASSHGSRTHRARMSELILTASNVRAAVTERAEKYGTLTGSGADLELPTYPWLASGLVGRDGAVVVYSAQLGMLAVLLPVPGRDSVTWSCQGMPPKYSPRSCRDVDGETSFAFRAGGSPREDALALLARAAPWQTQVESSALARGTLEASAPTTIAWRQGLTDFALLDSSGTMALYSDRHGTFALLEPRLVNGKVTWRCRVWPAAAATAGCASGQ